MKFVRDTINIGGDNLVAINESNDAEGLEDLDAYHYVEFLNGENSGKTGIITEKDGKYSVYKVFLVLLLGLCLNMLDMDTIRANYRYVRKPRIENLTA